jgi:GT2 family glycosyltransferase
MSGRPPLVSVVLPTYNRRATLGRAIDSVLTQTMEDLELLVVDDGSSDGTKTLVRGLEDTRVRFLRLPGNHGAPYARNRGIEAARGRYIAFQDSDDQWSPELLATHLQRLKQCPNARASCVAALRIHANGRVQAVPKRTRLPRDTCGDLSRELLEGSFIGTPMLLAERRLLLQAGLFDESLDHLLEDWELALRLSALTPIVFTRRALHRCILSPDSISQRALPRTTRATQAILSKHRARFRAHPAAMAVQYLKLASYALRTGSRLPALEFLGRAAVAGLRSPGGLLALLLRRGRGALQGALRSGEDELRGRSPESIVGRPLPRPPERG